MPDKAVTIRKMPEDLWWDARSQAVDERISVQDLVIKAIREYLLIHNTTA